jgi:hypothetical protein
LAIRNTIRYAGAVIVRRDALQTALEVIGPGWEEFSVTADWFLWVAVLRQGRVAYVPTALVDHVVRSGLVERHAKPSARQILRAQAHAQAHASVDPDLQKKASDFAWRVHQDEASAERAPLPATGPHAGFSVTKS